MGCGSGGWVQMGFGLEFAMGLILRWILGGFFLLDSNFVGFCFVDFALIFVVGHL